MHPATPCTSITDAFITVAENVLQPISKRNETAIRTTQSTRSTKPPVWRLPFYQTLGTPWLKNGAVSLQNRKKQTQNCKPSWRSSRWCTCATILYAKTSEGEDISYQDFTSLYPWVNKYGTYPVRFPEIIYNPADQNIFHYFGIAQVDILAPERLFLPVLPVREGGKLTFPLCRSRVREEMAKQLLEWSNMCGHTREQRMLRGTWCTPEL